MNDYYKRLLLFLGGCIPTRIFLMMFAKNNIDLLQTIGLFTLIPAIGFLYIYTNNKRQIGPETFGDKIWWNKLRPIHSFFYFMFSVFALNKNQNAWIFLLFDVLLGLLSFSYFHYNYIKK